MANESQGYREVIWESRNLSRPSFEIDYAEGGDSFARSMASIEAMRIPCFVQLRIPATDVTALRCAEDLGFRYGEMSIDPWIKADRAPVYQEFLSGRERFVPNGFSGSLREELVAVDELGPGVSAAIIDISTSVFKDDRFHMDPHCSRQLADNRIALWVEKDLFNPASANRCSLVFHGDALAGYILWRGERFILGGIASNYIGKGLAKYLYLASMEHVFLAGAKELSTTISVNNLEVHNLYSRLGFSFRKPVITLHYWRG